MKIALIGAQGVGKTTLSKALQSHYPNSFIVRETVRECPYPCDQGADFKTEWWVLSHSILAEQEAKELQKDLIITDRCLLDIAVYTKLINENAKDRLSDGQRQLIEASIMSWLKEDSYNAIFFLKVDPAIWATRDLDDGFRSLDPNWYQILTNEFEAAIERLRVNQFTRVEMITNNGEMQGTLDRLIRIIEGLKPAEIGSASELPAGGTSREPIRSFPNP
jgi:GTPase SAR1 family protein